MKKLLSIALLSVGLAFAMSSCKSDIEKYSEMKYNAANSPITVLETPEGFRLDMSENEWNEFIKQNTYEYHYNNYFDLLIGEKYYACTIHNEEFVDDKLCYYEICIEGRKDIDSVVSLTSSDVAYIVESYEEKLKGEFEHVLKQLADFLPVVHLWTKGNLVVEMECPKYEKGYIYIECCNQPFASELKKYKATFTDTPSTVTYEAEVKNNKWNGGVKQVEDYLEMTLRDPDSYESIEWSEVKRKEDGFYVRHKYRAKNGFGGYVVTNQLFHLDFSGNVVGVKDLY